MLEANQGEGCAVGPVRMETAEVKPLREGYGKNEEIPRQLKKKVR